MYPRYPFWGVACDHGRRRQNGRSCNATKTTGVFDAQLIAMEIPIFKSLAPIATLDRWKLRSSPWISQGRSTEKSEAITTVFLSYNAGLLLFSVGFPPARQIPPSRRILVHETAEGKCESYTKEIAVDCVSHLDLFVKIREKRNFTIRMSPASVQFRLCYHVFSFEKRKA